MTLLQKLEGGMTCATAKSLVDLGEAFGYLLKDGDIVALRGDLGVGKTTFTKGIAKALGIADSVTSPTFNIMIQYIGMINLMHIDAYRLDDCECLEVWDYVQRPCVIVIEWPERLVELQKNITHDLRITIRKNEKRWIILKMLNKKIL
ncbi:MAG: tRNA (adenosine(37)-N6)-threonylcarbamoyltransferase complex ATPase subunit type 1 TsaE [Puniceicoccales bacterium]|jgi:tRNA threonylcarbamoyladenosine biosynthesis protein TsaE|nr:tRNA (adenosine(37)-N6)-threonylcarbamoyltransferase complex ATPase subunit type 1 TsaE [Puniceicoccales bacterium]